MDGQRRQAACGGCDSHLRSRQVNPATDGSDGKMVRSGKEQLRFEGQRRTAAAYPGTVGTRAGSSASA